MRLFCVLGLSLAQGGLFEVRPSELDWKDLSPARFDLAFRLPEERTAPGRDLLAEMERLVQLRFEVEGPSGDSVRNFGDMVAVTRGLEDSEIRAWFRSLEKTAPRLMQDWGAGLIQLLSDDYLRSKRWKPGKDHSRDGILTAESWDLSQEPAHPWVELGKRPRAEQAATLMFAEPAAIKAAENDYSLYPQDKAATYKEIYPVDGEYHRGLDPDGEPFSVVRLYFRSDLPLFYDDYRCDLRILNRVDDAGRLRTEIYSRSEDFYWLAGRDHYLPVDDSRGQRIAQLVVRLYGFDLRGVPDGADDRRAALRASLGNLRLKAERIQRSSSGKDTPGALVPEFVLRGKR